MIETRPYQDAALDAIAAAEARGVRRMLVAMATGTGKTVTFAHLLRRRGGRAVVLAHRDELVQQARQKIRAVDPDVTVGVVRAGEDQVYAQVVVASVQTLARASRLERLLAAGRYRSELFKEPLGPIRTVIADEAHHFVAGDDGNTFGRVMEGLGCAIGAAEGPLAVGFTATPERADRKALGVYWEDVVYHLGIVDGIRLGCLVNLRAIEVQLECDFNQLHTRSGDLVAGETSEMLHEANAPKHAVAAYLEHAAGRKAILFTPTIALAREMADAFTAAGVPAESVDGGMDMAARRGVLQRLRTGETQVVANAQVLTEGFDEPSVACIILARPTRSRVLAIQAIGRGMRPYPGKEDCLVLDLVGSTSRTDLMTVANLFDLTPKQAREGIVGAIAAGRLEGATPEQQPRDGRLVYREVDLLGGKLHWVPTQQGAFTLSMGKFGSVSIVQRQPEEEASWDVVRVWHEGEGPERILRRKAVAEGLTMGYAQGVAEDRIRKVKAVSLNSKKAEWRRRPPTDKQRELLERWGAWRPSMTMGEASDAITARMAVRV